MLLTDDNVLHFHPMCGSNVKIAKNRKTVFRTK